MSLAALHDRVHKLETPDSFTFPYSKDEDEDETLIADCTGMTPPTEQCTEVMNNKVHDSGPTSPASSSHHSPEEWHSDEAREDCSENNEFVDNITSCTDDEEVDVTVASRRGHPKEPEQYNNIRCARDVDEEDCFLDVCSTEEQQHNSPGSDTLDQDTPYYETTGNSGHLVKRFNRNESRTPEINYREKSRDLSIHENYFAHLHVDSATSRPDHDFKKRMQASASQSGIQEDSKITLDLNSNGSVYHIDGFSCYFTHNLFTLRHRQLFCDVILKTTSKDFYAHKVVLAACSPYFYNVLQKKAVTQSELTNKEDPGTFTYIDLGNSVTPCGLQAVLDCIYSSRIALQKSTVYEVLAAATFLNMQLILDACLKYLQSENEQEKKTTDIHEKPDIHLHENQELNDAAIDLRAPARSQHESAPAARDSGRESFDSCHVVTRQRFPEPENRQALSDQEEKAIYQGSSPQQNDNDIKTASPKSINWKKYKYITKSQQESDEEKSTYDRSFPTDRSDVNAVHRSSETTPVKTAATSNGSSLWNPFLGNSTSRKTSSVIEEDQDDVFVHKENLRANEEHRTPFTSPNPYGIPTGMNTFAADLIRRHQREIYGRVIANAPYLLNPDAMAAAMAMTALTPSARTPTNNQSFLPLHGMGQLGYNTKQWHHSLSRQYNRPQEDEKARHFAHFKSLPPTSLNQPTSISEEHTMRQHPFFLAANAHRHTQPLPPARSYETNRRDSMEDRKPEYSPLLLKNLLRSSESESPHSPTTKRTYSTTSTDSGNQAQYSAKRFFADRNGMPTSTTKDSHLHNSIKDLVGVNIPNHRQRRPASSIGSSSSPDRPYKCLVCAAEFNRPANLKTHMRIHSGEKPYKCQSCGARFVQVAHLRAHILIHTGEKPYPCKVCGTRFRHLQTLKSHLRIHTGEKPYACDECKVRFRHKSQLRLHLRTKHGINTNTKKTYQQVPGLRSADICAHIKRTQEAVRIQAATKKEL